MARRSPDDVTGLPPRRDRRSTRRTRTSVYVENPDGVTRGEDTTASSDWGKREVWIQAGDVPAGSSRQDYVDAVLARAAQRHRSLDVGVGTEPFAPYSDYEPGDEIMVEDHTGEQTVRIAAMSVSLGDQVDVDLTLDTAAELETRRLERLVEMLEASGEADAASQSRHGRTTPDRLDDGPMRGTEGMRSDNFTAGSSGWQIQGSGDAEFNNITARGSIRASTISNGESGEARVQLDPNDPNDVQWIDSSGNTIRLSQGSADSLNLNADLAVDDFNAAGSITGEGNKTLVFNSDGTVTWT